MATIKTTSEGLPGHLLMLSPIVSYRGEPIQYALYVSRLFKQMPDVEQTILHAAVGVAGEGGELLDAAKKYWAYGNPLDVDNVKEELGDLLFYIQAMANEIGTTLPELLQKNVDKLSVRYGSSYSDSAAIARVDKVENTLSYNALITNRNNP